MGGGTKFLHCDERRNLHARYLNISCGSYSFPADLSAGPSVKVGFSIIKNCIYAAFHIIPTFAMVGFEENIGLGIIYKILIIDSSNIALTVTQKFC